MNRKMYTRLRKMTLLVAALFLGWAARAQTTDNTLPADSTHHHMMRHRWNDRPGSPDSLANHRFHRSDGFHDRDFARRGRGFGRGQRNFIHYSPEQRQQVMAINKDYRQKREDLFKQDNITLKQYKDGLVALQKDRKSKLGTLLTPQQKSEMAARRKRRDDNAQVRAAARLERLRLNLNLTDDQVARLKAGQQDLRSKARAIHENDNLLPQEKRMQLKALMASRNDNFKSILTPEQYNKLQQMGHHRFGGSWQGDGSSSGRTT